MVVDDAIALSWVEDFRPSNLAGPIADWIVSALHWVIPPAAAARFAEHVRLEELARMTVGTAMFVAGLLVLVFALESFTGADRSSYRSRVFRQDVLYTLFYHGGFYDMLIWASLANALSPHLAFLRVDAFAGLPGPVHWVMFWIAADLLYYWTHRWQHTWGPLWAMHSVHHSQEEMTFASTFRFHPLDQLTNSLLGAVLLSVIGVPTFFWLPLYAAMQVLDAIQHSSLTWGYGRAYRVLVSPRFHAFHHSADPEHHNRNYSKILSVWDFLFGTAVEGQVRPARLGVDGLPVPRTLVAQMLAPFRILSRSRRRGATAASPRAAMIEVGGARPIAHVAVAALFAVMPLLPVGPRYLGLAWPNAIDLAVAALAGVWLLVRVADAAERPRSWGAATTVLSAWLMFALAAVGATAVGLAAENRWASPVFTAYWPEIWSRIAAPVQLAADPFYPARAGLSVIEGFVVFATLVDTCRRSRNPQALTRAGVLGALVGLVLVSGLAVAQFVGRFQLDPRWVAANPAIVRSHATLDDPNALASYLVLGLGLTLGLAASGTTRRDRVAAAAVAAAAALALVTTGSRTGQGAALVSGLVVVAWTPSGARALLGRHAARLRRLARAALAVLVVGLVSLVSARLVLPQSIPDRPTSRLESLRQTLDPYVSWRWVLSDRPAYARAALRMAVAHPLTGVGMGRYARVLPEYREHWLSEQNAHNYFAQVLAETGVPGALAWMAVLVSALLVLVQAAGGSDRGTAGMAVGGVFATVAFGLSLLMGHPLVLPSGQILFASILALGLVASGALDLRPSLSGPPRAAVCMAIAVAAGLYAVAAGRTLPPPHATRVWGYEWGLHPEEWAFLPQEYALPEEPDNPISGPPGTRWGRFRWTRERAVFELTVPAGATACELKFTPFLPVTGAVQEVRVATAKGMQVVRVDTGALQTVRLDLPTAVDRPGPARVLVRLLVTPTRSPYELGQSEDRRRLGVQLFRPRCFTDSAAADVTPTPLRAGR